MGEGKERRYLPSLTSKEKRGAEKGVAVVMKEGERKKKKNLSAGEKKILLFPREEGDEKGH